MINIYYDGNGYGDGDEDGDPIYKIEFQRFMNLE